MTPVPDEHIAYISRANEGLDALGKRARVRICIIRPQEGAFNWKVWVESTDGLCVETYWEQLCVSECDLRRSITFAVVQAVING